MDHVPGWLASEAPPASASREAASLYPTRADDGFVPVHPGGRQGLIGVHVRVRGLLDRRVPENARYDLHRLTGHVPVEHLDHDAEVQPTFVGAVTHSGTTRCAPARGGARHSPRNRRLPHRPTPLH